MVATRVVCNRRAVVMGLCAFMLQSCRCASSSSTSSSSSVVGSGAWKELHFPAETEVSEGQQALLLLPEGGGTRPLLVALHGRGEAVRGVAVGARGWRDDYHLDTLLARLKAPPLSAADLGDMVTVDRLARLNASLAKQPYQGLCLATPFTPDLQDRSPQGAEAFGRFIVQQLLPKVAAECGHPARREATGIDGVSLGGRLSLLVGLAHPEVFGAVGALQPAIRPEEAQLFSSLAQKAMQKHPVRLRLVSSEEDPFLPAVQALSQQLTRDGVIHDFLVAKGPHDYAWNRGPGGIEMMLWHERVLRGLPAP